MSAAALKQRLRADLKAAMQARVTGEVGVLRALIAALDNAEAVPTEGYRPRALGASPGDVARRQLDGKMVAALLADEVEARLAAAADYERHGRSADADRLRSEVAIVSHYAGL